MDILTKWKEGKKGRRKEKRKETREGGRRQQEEGCRYKNLSIYLMNREKVKVRKKNAQSYTLSWDGCGL